MPQKSTLLEKLCNKSTLGSIIMVMGVVSTLTNDQYARYIADFELKVSQNVATLDTSNLISIKETTDMVSSGMEQLKGYTMIIVVVECICVLCSVRLFFKEVTDRTAVMWRVLLAIASFSLIMTVVKLLLSAILAQGTLSLADTIIKAVDQITSLAATAMATSLRELQYPYDGNDPTATGTATEVTEDMCGPIMEVIQGGNMASTIVDAVGGSSRQLFGDSGADMSDPALIMQCIFFEIKNGGGKAITQALVLVNLVDMLIEYGSAAVEMVSLKASLKKANVHV